MPSACGQLSASPTSQERDVGHPSRAARSLVFLGVLCHVAAGLAAAQAFELIEQTRIMDRRADNIGPAGPFTQIDAAATVGAEWHVLTVSEHECAAGGATQRLGLQLRHGFILGCPVAPG